MTSLKEDAEKARGMIAEEQKILSRETKLAQYIGDIERIYHSIPQTVPVGNIKTNEVYFQYKSYPCQLPSDQSVDVVVSLGVKDNHYASTAYGEAWVQVAFYNAHHTGADKPKVLKELILGKQQVGIKSDNEVVTLLSLDNQINEEIRYIHDAISLVVDSLAMERSSTLLSGSG